MPENEPYQHKGHFVGKHGDSLEDIHRYIKYTAGFIFACFGLKFPSGFQVLDVGASDGWMGFCLREIYPHLEYIGLDPTPDAPQVQEGTMRINGLPPGSQFDLIIYNHTLEHIANVQAEIALAAIHLKSTGCIFIAVPDAGSPWAWDYDSHINLFNEKILLRLLEGAGFYVDTPAVAHMRFRRDCEELWILARLR